MTFKECFNDISSKQTLYINAHNDEQRLQFDPKLWLKYTSGVQPMRSLVPCWRVFQPNLRLHGNRSSQNLVLRWLDTTGVPQPKLLKNMKHN